MSCTEGRTRFSHRSVDQELLLQTLEVLLQLGEAVEKRLDGQNERQMELERRVAMLEAPTQIRRVA